MNTESTNIAIVVPYIAEYSRRLYSDLHTELDACGIRLHLLHGVPQGSQAQRQDAISLPFAHQLRTKYFRTPLGRWDYKSISGYLRRERVQYVILEQAIRHIETHLEILGSSARRRHIAFWGHGYAHHRNEGRVSAKLRKMMTTRGDWTFVYTSAGRQRLIDDGFSPARISVVNNTIDTEVLLYDLSEIDEQALSDYRTAMGLSPGKVGLFLGGVDESKGIHELLDLANQVANQEPDFRLLIGGMGELSSLCINAANERNYIKYLGPLHAKDKALALSAADFIIIPRRVGLVAVESIIAKLPLITQDVEGHGPELAYCQEFGNLRLSTPNVSSLLDLVLKEIRNPHRYIEADESHQVQLDVSYQKMLGSLKDGILEWIGSDSNWMNSPA